MDDLGEQLEAYGARAAGEVEPVTPDEARGAAAPAEAVPGSAEPRPLAVALDPPVARGHRIGRLVGAAAALIVLVGLAATLIGDDESTEDVDLVDQPTATNEYTDPVPSPSALPPTTEPTVPYVTLPVREVGEPVEWSWYGLTKDEAIAKAEEESRPWRIGREDEEEFGGTADFRPGRVTFSIDDGVVTFALIESTSGLTVEGVDHLEDVAYLGLTEADALARALDEGREARVIAVDGFLQDRNDDARAERLNLVIVDDHVVGIQRF